MPTAVLTPGQTWTAPAGVTTCAVQAWGPAGGGQAGVDLTTRNCAGGGGGGYASGGGLTVTPGNTYGAVGAGGAGGTAGSGANGTDGGTTLFQDDLGNFVEAFGGTGGANGVAGTGGGPNTSQVTNPVGFTGGNGDIGEDLPVTGDHLGGGGGGGAGSTGSGGNASVGTGGTGAAEGGNGGGGGQSDFGTDNDDGAAGASLGGGGGGAFNGGAGGNGADGQMIITYATSVNASGSFLAGVSVLSGIGAQISPPATGGKIPRARIPATNYHPWLEWQ